MTLDQQFMTLLVMIAGSFVVGIVFDGYRILKNLIKLTKWIVFLIDILFGIISALFIFYLLLWSNNGQLRFIIIFIFFVGLWLYYLSISSYIIIFWRLIYDLIYKLWTVVIYLFKYLFIKPITSVFKILIIILTFLITASYSVVKFIYKFFAIFLSKFYFYLKKIAIGSGIAKKTKEGFFSIIKKVFKRK